MIYEKEQTIDSYYHSADNRYITASAYLKGLHHKDEPSELMPKDAIYLKSARRFYNSLSAEDKLIIDSFSDHQTIEIINVKQRNIRFNELVQLFIYHLGTSSKHNLMLPFKEDKERKIING